MEGGDQKGRNYLNKQDKVVLMQLIHECNIRRLTVNESLSYIKRQMGDQKGIISTNTFFRRKKELRADSKKWIFELAHNKEDFVAEYRQRVYELESNQRELWRVYRDTDDDKVKVMCQLGLSRITMLMVDLMDSLPIVAALKSPNLEKMDRP